jgi:hypothetical protein
MFRDILIGTHAAAGTAAFAAGVVLVAQIARARETRLFGLYLAGLALLAATAGALVGSDWLTFEAPLKIAFVALVVLAAAMLAAGSRARRLTRQRRPGWRRGSVAAVGFTLISLFAGFVIIASMDAGAPGWAAAVIAVAGIAGGRQAVRRTEGIAAHAEQQSAATCPARLAGSRLQETGFGRS